jgi:hypothetical protein
MKINNLLRGDLYSAPTIDVVEFATEAGFAASLVWGEEGAAGQSGVYEESDVEL